MVTFQLTIPDNIWTALGMTSEEAKAWLKAIVKSRVVGNKAEEISAEKEAERIAAIQAYLDSLT